MKTFTQPMQGLKEFEDLEAALPKLSGVIQISGCIDAAKPHMMYSIGNGSGNRIIVTFQEQKAKELAEERCLLSGKGYSVLPVGYPGKCADSGAYQCPQDDGGKALVHNCNDV